MFFWFGHLRLFSQCSQPCNPSTFAAMLTDLSTDIAVRPETLAKPGKFAGLHLQRIMSNGCLIDATKKHGCEYHAASVVAMAVLSVRSLSVMSLSLHVNWTGLDEPDSIKSNLKRPKTIEICHGSVGNLSLSLPWCASLDLLCMQWPMCQCATWTTLDIIWFVCLINNQIHTQNHW